MHSTSSERLRFSLLGIVGPVVNQSVDSTLATGGAWSKNCSLYLQILFKLLKLTRVNSSFKVAHQVLNQVEDVAWGKCSQQVPEQSSDPTVPLPSPFRMAQSFLLLLYGGSSQHLESEQPSAYKLGVVELRNYMATSKPRKQAVLAEKAGIITALNTLYKDVPLLSWVSSFSTSETIRICPRRCSLEAGPHHGSGDGHSPAEDPCDAPVTRIPGTLSSLTLFPSGVKIFFTTWMSWNTSHWLEPLEWGRAQIPFRCWEFQTLGTAFLQSLWYQRMYLVSPQEALTCNKHLILFPGLMIPVVNMSDNNSK